MINLNNLKKEEILWLYNHFCKHGHRYLEHPKCYESEIEGKQYQEKTGILDIESLGFTANWGYVICYCLKELDGKITKRVLTTNEIRTYTFDEKLLRQFYEDVKQFDRLVVYWGKDRRHDLPYLRSRALKWNIDFPIYREKFVVDLYDMVKGKLRLNNNRLATACQFFDIPAKDHPIKPDIWCKALTGHKKSLDYILLHCEEDVKATEALYKKLIVFAKKSRTSI